MMRSGPWIWGAWMPVWRLSWPRLWRDRWHWLVRRWVFALAGFVVGLLGLCGWQFEAVETLWESEAQALELQLKLKAHEQLQPAQGQQSAQSAALNVLTGPPAVMAWWPLQGTQAAVWPQLERLVAQQGLRLLSLRLEPPNPSTAWPSQKVALRLQGRFDDWVAVWAAMNAQGPVWGIERLRITPQEDGVAIDALLQLWLSPESTAMPALAGTSVLTEQMKGAGQVALRAGQGSPVFLATTSQPLVSPLAAPGLAAQDITPAPTAVASRASAAEGHSLPSSMPVLSPDPAHWPVELVRLAGVLQFAQDAQLILQAGPHWVRAHVGQRIGSDGHVVNSIHAREVHLRSAQGPMWVISLDKAKP